MIAWGISMAPCHRHLACIRPCYAKLEFTWAIAAHHYMEGTSPHSQRLRTNIPLIQETPMIWKKPMIVEMQVGMEINMYACAVRK